jgi:hypothetical protein
VPITSPTLSIAHKLAWSSGEVTSVPARPNVAPTSRPAAAMRLSMLFELAVMASLLAAMERVVQLPNDMRISYGSGRWSGPSAACSG